VVEMLLDVLDLQDKVKLKFLDTLLKAFSGFEREWCIKDSGGYSHRFFVRRADELLPYFNKNCELHMTVCRYGSQYNILDWTLVIDIDVEESLKECCLKKVKKLLDEFNLFYLIDNRFHIWFPDWEHTLLDDWNSYYGNVEDFVEPLAIYIEKVCGLPENSIDRMLWKVRRHTIRMPYSKHLEHKQQVFIYPPNLSVEDYLSLWTGVAIDSPEHKHNTYYYALNFKFFIENALKFGRELLYFLNEDEMEDNEPSFERKGNVIPWIERLLKTQIPIGYRGSFLWLVISPYLVNVRKCSREEALSIVNNWLRLCKASRFEDSDLYGYLPSNYNYFKRKKIMPCSLRTLKNKYSELYEVLVEKKVLEA